MAKNDILTQEQARQILDYDPDTGVFRWRRRQDVGLAWNNRNAGKIAGHVSVKGHVHVMVNRQRIYAHRLAWLIMTGGYPGADIDHINGDKSDNRFSNLRAASRAENNYNRAIQRNNKTGVKGVYPYKNRFRSQIVVDGNIKHIGVFGTLDEAKAAYEKAAAQYHGEFAYSKRPECQTSKRLSKNS